MTKTRMSYDQVKNDKEVSVHFCLYSPDNTKGSVSDGSVRLNVQLLLWML